MSYMWKTDRYKAVFDRIRQVFVLFGGAREKERGCEGREGEVMRSIPFWDGTPEGFEEYCRQVEGLGGNVSLLSEVAKKTKEAIEEMEKESGRTKNTN